MLELDAPALASRAAPERFVLLDVREPWEVQTARIDLPGATALHIPMRAVPSRLGEIPQQRPVACICHHGARSAQVVAFLMHHGYHDVYNLAGGVDAWSTQVDPGVPRY
jgi:rhodanese-related sulfurtransferase